MVINLKNKLWIIFVLIIIIGISVGFYFFTRNNNQNQDDYSAVRSSTNTTDTTQNPTRIEPKKEEEIAFFSTKIYNTTDANRQNNISITCNTLNDTVVANGSTFSFCDTVGQATTKRGYLKAEIFDKYGNVKHGLGGGNCQVSTTLYNAVLQIPSLAIIERHEHSNYVPYIEQGKDAAVAYGSYDFKFRNDFGFDIKIRAENTADSINISLNKTS